MARVSLKEAYDNKDVVAQIYAIRDIAEGASDTADSAVTTANDAKTYVDTLGVQVEGAVQTANNASASAQTSAETVAGYDARLTEVEGDLNQAESDLGAVTLRVTTAEGDIVTIQGRITALETADAQNVKLAGAQNITGVKTVPTSETGIRDTQIANGTRVQNDLDAYEPMVRTTGTQYVYGEKITPRKLSNPHTNLNGVDYIIGKFQYAYDVRIHTFMGFYVDRRASGSFYIRVGTDGAITAEFKGISTPYTEVVVYVDTNNIIHLGLNSTNNSNADMNIQVIYAAGNSIGMTPVFDTAENVGGLTLLGTSAWTVL